MIVGRNAVAGDLSHNSRAALLRRIEVLQQEDRCAFTQNQAGAFTIEWPASFRRRGLERIEPDEDQLGEGVVAPREDPLIPAGSDALESMANRVRPGGAGVRNHLAGCREAESLLRVHHGLLRRVVRDERSRALPGGPASF